jgi:hypothetical protein
LWTEKKRKSNKNRSAVIMPDLGKIAEENVTDDELEEELGCSMRFIGS